MLKIIGIAVLILSVIYTGALAEPVLHRLRIRFPGASSDKIGIPKPAKQEVAPYPAAGFKPEPAFELPEVTYLPPSEPEETYLPPDGEYGPPAEPEAAYGPPANSYAPPDNTYDAPETPDFQSETIVNAPLTIATQFTPPRPNQAVSFRPFRPQSANIVNAPVSHLTVPRPQSTIAFRPRRPQVLSQQLYPQTYLTLPRVERLIEFRPRRVPHQQQSNFFSRPLPSNIFGNSNNGRSGRRQLPSKIFSN